MNEVSVIKEGWLHKRGEQGAPTHSTGAERGKRGITCPAAGFLSGVLGEAELCVLWKLRPVQNEVAHPLAVSSVLGSTLHGWWGGRGSGQNVISACFTKRCRCCFLWVLTGAVVRSGIPGIPN